jgi:hypothetical protein
VLSEAGLVSLVAACREWKATIFSANSIDYLLREKSTQDSGIFGQS